MPRPRPPPIIWRIPPPPIAALMGMPRPPMPRPPPMGAPPPCWCSWASWLLGFLTVSSMDSTRHAASVAADMELILLVTGSHTPSSIVSQIPSRSMSTPNHLPLPATACFWRRRFNTSVESKPALSASWRGMRSRALAYAATMSCSLPMRVRLKSFKARDTSSSVAPPPATMVLLRKQFFTIISESCRERSVSSMNCSAPPRRTMVAVFASGQPVNRLYRSAPTCFSSNSAHSPRTSGFRPCTVVCTRPRVARATRCRSWSLTRPAQNRSRSAKYWVAKSPMGFLDRMIWAPEATHLANLS
mmetsp:Transcript_46881/g.95516  ORF Transcript_46881/g.95516 Transcript_46881/m.95516 type:complete len:301 (-) Transcript_46881:957-1859(-)